MKWQPESGASKTATSRTSRAHTRSFSLEPNNWYRPFLTTVPDFLYVGGRVRGGPHFQAAHRTRNINGKTRSSADAQHHQPRHQYQDRHGLQRSEYPSEGTTELRLQ